MSDTRCGCDKIDGVKCDVTNCRYHGPNDCCQADGIRVESHNAMRKAETFCGTFESKTAM